MNHCKPVLPNCWFDEQKCQTILTHLDNYRKRYSEPLSMFLKEPLHDEASHGADAFRTFAVNADKIGDRPKPPPMRTQSGSWMSM